MLLSNISNKNLWFYICFFNLISIFWQMSRGFMMSLSSPRTCLSLNSWSPQHVKQRKFRVENSSTLHLHKNSSVKIHYSENEGKRRNKRVSNWFSTGNTNFRAFREQTCIWGTIRGRIFPTHQTTPKAP